MAPVSFDSGVLVGLDRGDPRAWAWMKRAVERGEPPLVSAAAIAECWRGSRQARLAGALSGCVVRDVDETLARTAGAALAASGHDDPVDALVAATAAAAGAVLVTGDPGNMQLLADRAFRGLRLAPLR